MKHALYLPPFGELADPEALVDIAQAAEGSGWDGLFLWDHVLRPADEPAEIADCWIALTAVATCTDRIRLGPMVTPLVRRRPQKLAREIVTLDHVSKGRLTVGLGLGVDRGRELTAFGELTDERARGDLLDEGAALLADLLAGEEVDHRGQYFTAEQVRFRPTSVQRPRPPLWFASRGQARRPVRRAARYDGLFPIEVDLDQFRVAVGIVEGERGGLDGFDVAVLAIPGVDLTAFADAGATWAMHSFLPGESAADVLTYIGEDHRQP
jgi:alkanesulfonate monooxygenase SsuD/methylene tetrahydromethanopterin reductase-like flavin-dependent oxidoreductase (luciferase family)